jgi:hypothetical protein
VHAFEDFGDFFKEIGIVSIIYELSVIFVLLFKQKHYKVTICILIFVVFLNVLANALPAIIF